MVMAEANTVDIWGHTRETFVYHGESKPQLYAGLMIRVEDKSSGSRSNSIL